MIRVKEKVQNSREFYLSIRFFLLSNIFVSFFFHFLFATDIDLRGRPMGFIPINAAIRDIRIDYNNTLPKNRSDTFILSFVREREKSWREYLSNKNSQRDASH